MRRRSGYVVGLVVIGAIAVHRLCAGCGPASPPSHLASIDTSLAPEPAIADPSADAPVTAGAWIVRALDADVGEVELHVRARIAPGHYLHATNAGPPSTPTSIELGPSNVISPAGEWELLTPPDDRGRLKESVQFRRRLRLRENATPGRYDVECTLKYQACTDELCWPPRVLKLQAPLVLQAKGR